MTTEALVKQKKLQVFDFDIPESVLDHYLTKDCIAVDTETRGLVIPRDRLCLVQISDDEGLVTFVKFQDLFYIYPFQNLIQDIYFCFQI